MIRDFQDYDGGPTVECDLCIVGAGAAGISTGNEFLNGQSRVIILESGGLEWEEDTQALYGGASVGTPYYDLMDCRLRYFGGTTNHWGGMCSRLDSIDFAPRSWVPHSGWPITRDDLDPFYARAHQIVDIGAMNYDQAEVSPPGTRYLELDPDKISHKVWRYSVPPTSFAEKYKPGLERDPKVEVWLHANLVEVETDDQARHVTGVKVASLGGKRVTVRARHYILAMGGIENARHLLAANRVIPGGLGNQHDLVGRFFMEHLRIRAGSILLTGDWYKSYLHLDHQGHEVRSALRPSESAQAREQLLNSMTMFGEIDRIRWTSKGYGSLFVLKESLKSGQMPEHLGRELWNIVTDVQGIVGGMLEKADFGTYVGMEGEQSPNPDSRITLIGERDALGVPRVQLAWRMLPIDKRTIRRFFELIGEEFGRVKAGRVQMDDWLADPDDLTWSDELIGENHHIGVTRMAADPRQGVVDANCRVHGLDNLYVAGSSVFVTSGCANPTLTIVALALRLADHLKPNLA